MDPTVKAGMVERLKFGCKMILKSSAESINIMKQHPIANQRSIRRNADSLRDPDPLSSSIANMSLKFPITMSADSEWRWSLPNGLVADYMDTRKGGRVPCSMSTVPVYISMQMEKKVEVKADSIRKLLSTGLANLEIIRNYDWENINYERGEVNFTRRRVATNPSGLDIKRNVVQKILIGMLCPGFSTEYETVADDDVKAIHDIVSSDCLDHRSAASLIQYVSSCVTKKMRWLPLIEGLSANLIPVGGLLFQPSFRAMDLGPQITTMRGHDNAVNRVCMALIYKYQQEGRSVDTMRMDSKLFTIGGRAFPEMLEDVHENSFVRFVKAALGMQIRTELEYRGIKMYPVPSNEIRVVPQSNGHFNWHSVMGTEAVHFKGRGTRGCFKHDGAIISSIIMEPIGEMDLQAVIAAIGSFCGVGIQSSRCRSYKTARESSYKQILAQPWKAWNGTRDEYDALCMDLENEDGELPPAVGALKLARNIVIEEGRRAYANVSDDKLLHPSGQLLARVPVIHDLPVLDPIVATSSPTLFVFLSPIPKFVAVFKYFWSHAALILQSIREGRRWKWQVDHVLRSCVQTQVGHIMLTARHIISQHPDFSSELRPTVVLALMLYGTRAPDARSRIISSFTYQGQRVEFGAGTGAVFSNRALRGVSVFGAFIERGTRFRSDAIIYRGVVPGFVAYPVPNPRPVGLPLYSINALRAMDLRTKPLNYQCYSHLHGFEVLMRRNQAAELEFTETLRRYVVMDYPTESSVALSSYLQERKRSGSVMEGPSNKRPRLTSNQPSSSSSSSLGAGPSSVQ